MELLWDSPAAAGHNRKTVFRVALTSEGDRKAARALDASLRQSSSIARLSTRARGKQAGINFSQHRSGDLRGVCRMTCNAFF